MRGGPPHMCRTTRAEPLSYWTTRANPLTWTKPPEPMSSLELDNQSRTFSYVLNNQSQPPHLCRTTRAGSPLCRTIRAGPQLYQTTRAGSQSYRFSPRTSTVSDNQLSCRISIIPVTTRPIIMPDLHHFGHCPISKIGFKLKLVYSLLPWVWRGMLGYQLSYFVKWYFYHILMYDYLYIYLGFSLFLLKLSIFIMIIFHFPNPI